MDKRYDYGKILSGYTRVCFVSYSKDTWYAFKGFYDYLKDRDDCKITIIYAGETLDLSFDGGDYDVIFVQDIKTGKTLIQKNLRGKIVYMPYYILEEPDADNPDNLAFIRGIVTSDIVIKADKVLVQSENMRLSYINILENETDIERRVWEDKIGVCSDALMRNLGKKNPDNKKTIAYEILPGSFLAYEDKIIDKLKENLSVFESYSDSINIRWIINEDMDKIKPCINPGIYEEYEALKEEYCRKSWVIKDDGKDGYKTAYLSDAFYGDLCENTYLFKLLNKPVMIADFNINNA